MSEDPTILDQARRAMEASPDDAGARLRFYERLADGELFLLLESESDGDSITPQVFPMDAGNVVLVFDREERLAAFLGGPAHFAALSGRHVVRMLAGQGIGLGVNFGVEGVEIAIPAEAVDWLAETLAHRPEVAEEIPREVSSPGEVPERLLIGLDAKLAGAAGLARFAYLAGVSYDSGRRGHLLAFIDALPGAEDSLALAAGEALTFSGLEAGEIDVAFFAASDAIAGRLAKVGLRFDLPDLPRQEMTEVKAPGMDPDEPPILH
ncbi:SseB family protein [Tropicimonas sp. IMCC34043]|uniref:SseB family protein n=1 Tax=Tropicimonas sp. IMCC34043 TaxID=2248760 RepID=UPI000E2226BC|nr:SseB family protein [Tropicimonas sp. IMCC34043]